MTGPTEGNGYLGQADPTHTAHPDLSAIAGGMRAEWRAEQAAAAADAAAQWRYSRGVVEWLLDRMHAGDRIAVMVTANAFEGLVDEVGEDFVALRAATGRVEIHVADGIPMSFELVQHATRGGTGGSVRRAFLDALLGRDEQRDIRVGTVQRPDALQGTLRVGRDYVSVVSSTGTETLVP